MAREVFGEALDLDPIRLLAAPRPLARAFTAGRHAFRDWIVWPRAGLVADFSTARLSQRAILIHELVHVWQAQKGVGLIGAKIRAGDGPAAYAYPMDDSCAWAGLNIEQQASLVEHRYRLAHGGSVPGDRGFYDRVCPFPSPSI
jgi:hypothetical protein